MWARACREEAHVAEVWPLSREWFLWAGTGGRRDGRQAARQHWPHKLSMRGRGISFYEDIGHMVELEGAVGGGIFLFGRMCAMRATMCVVCDGRYLCERGEMR